MGYSKIKNEVRDEFYTSQIILNTFHPKKDHTYIRNLIRNNI